MGGYDLVGDNFDGKVSQSGRRRRLTYFLGMNAPVPDSDPLDQCAGMDHECLKSWMTLMHRSGHGTHVAVCLSSSPRTGHMPTQREIFTGYYSRGSYQCI